MIDQRLKRLLFAVLVIADVNLPIFGALPNGCPRVLSILPAHAASASGSVAEASADQTGAMDSHMGMYFLGAVLLLGLAGGAVWLFRCAEERRCRRAMDSIPDMAAMFDANLKFKYVNPEVERFSGFPASRFLGKSCGEIWPARICETFLPALQEALATRQSKRLNVSFRLPKIGRYSLAITFAPLLDKNGMVQEILGVAHDYSEIVERKLETERISRLYAGLSHVSQAIAHARTRDELFEKVSKSLVVHGKFDLVWIGWHDPESHILTPLVYSGEVQVEASEVLVRTDEGPLSQGPAGTCIREERTVVNNAIGGDPRMIAWSRLLKIANGQSAAALPIRFDGKVAGALVVYSHEPGFFDTPKIKLLEEAAREISFALDRMESERVHVQVLRDLEETRSLLQTERDKFLGFLESMPLGIYIANGAGEIEFVNPALQREFGPVNGRKCHEYFYDNPENCPICFNEAVLSGQTIRREWFSPKNAKTYDLIYAPVQGSDPKVSRLGVFYDISKRKKAEKALKDSEEHYRSLFENMLNAYAHCKMVYDDAGKPRDFIFLDVNTAFMSMTGLPNVVGKYASQVLHGYQMVDSELLEVFGRVSKSGQPERFETCLKSINQWLSLCVYSPQRDYFAVIFEVITDRVLAAEVVRVSEDRYRNLVEQASDGIVTTNDAGRFLEVNSRFCEMTGYTHDELLQMSMHALISADESADLTKHFLSIHNEKPHLSIWSLARKDGVSFNVEVNSRMVNENTRLMIIRNITDRQFEEEERANLKAQLLQSQKMEAVGRLAGGVAHDFNNMLQAILGYTELALDTADPESPLVGDLNEIYSAAQRSADLTHQLLAFARKQTISPQVVDLNDALSGMLKMLQRLIGEDINLVWSPGHDLWKIHIDPSQLDQILANLAVNARDAINGVGKLAIKTQNASLDIDYCASHLGSTPGDYVILSVGDNGCGMDEKTLEMIFEPFFTTKGLGEGTGLGLSTVYGIVKQNNGFINVESSLGVGTTFRIYLPRFVEGANGSEGQDLDAMPIGGNETILVVEDEDTILFMTKRILENLGYTTLAAKSPTEAIDIVQNYAQPIHLLLTDVVMPEMNGRVLSKYLTTRCPDMKVLFMSGYTADVIARRGILEEGVSLLQKPFSFHSLANGVRQALEATKDD